MARPRTVYRGKRRYRWIITVLLLIVIALLAAGLWLFGFLQNYIVYDTGGLHLVLPFAQDEEDAAAGEEQQGVYTGPAVDAEVVVDEPDYTSVEPVAGENVPELHARYVIAASVSVSNLNGYASTLEAGGQNAMVLQLKGADGYLSYRSTVPTADAYGVNGSEDITEAVAALKEDGVYLVAMISTLLDNAMAERNGPIALKDWEGNAVRDSLGCWLDPYNAQVREYVTDLMSELAVMGFDEVVLTGLGGPEVGEFSFSQEMTGTPSLSDAVSAFSLAMSRKAQELGLRCSCLCREDALRAGNSLAVGQDLPLFFKAFDRVYLHSDAYDLQNDLSLLRASLSGGEENRIVPIITGYAPDTGSWAVQ